MTDGQGGDAKTAIFVGGCACGAVRYEVRAEPLFSFHCQCRQCQRASGAGHSSLIMVPAAGVTLTGELAYHDQAADSGNLVSRGFCPTCGSPLIGKNSGYPDVRFLTAGSLDDPSRFAPQKVVWSSGGQPWDRLDPELPRA